MKVREKEYYVTYLPILIKREFHLGQAWYRKISKLGLTGEYKNVDSPTGQWLKMLFGLPALPPHEVVMCYTEMLLPMKPLDLVLDVFTAYLERTYMNAGCTFPPMWWAGHTDVTTTNACESFHQNLKYSSSHSHPDIWKLIATLEKEQIKTRLKMRALRALCQERSTREETTKKAAQRWI